MDAIEMVKCFLRKPGEEERSIRFVPLEIFGLWRVLMVRVHGFALLDPEVSRWIPDESEYQIYTPEMESEAERVVEISFKYVESGRPDRPIVRYFPSAEYQDIIGFFRSHFPDESKMEGVLQRKGRYLKNRAVPYTEK
ncbi:MAG TPA: hypothetical protein PK961_16005 [bacterium]|nr:hypothetical protein [bacterium]